MSELQGTETIAELGWQNIQVQINSLCTLTFNDMTNRGFHDPLQKSRNEEAILALAILDLVHSEVSEASEEVRTGRPLTMIRYESKDGHVSHVKGGEFQKPVGFPVELADTVIRIFDLCGFYGIDLGRAIREKTEYNRTRPRKHGKVA